MTTQEIVSLNNQGKPTTTSRKIADRFEKMHKHVLAAIRNLDCSPEFNRTNFRPVEYTDDKGETQPEIEITRDGFSFLVMGFTGKKAAAFKEEFINAFNQMEASLNGTNHMNEDELIFAGFKALQGRVKNLTYENAILSEKFIKANETIKLQAPKVEYVNEVLASEDVHTTTTIAKELDMSGKALNKILNQKGIQYKQDGHWVLYSKYQNKGYTKTRTTPILHTDGTPGASISTVWTEEGRLFIHQLLNPAYIKPLFNKEARA